MDDVAQLTHDSDFSRFVAGNVDPGVKHAAMKKLFRDPRFNVMDRLDVYIDDYGQPDPLPAGMLRQMVQSRMLGLFDDAPAAEAAAADTADAAAPRQAPQALADTVPPAPPERTGAAGPAGPDNGPDEPPRTAPRAG